MKSANGLCPLRLRSQFGRLTKSDSCPEEAMKKASEAQDEAPWSSETDRNAPARPVDSDAPHQTAATRVHPRAAGPLIHRSPHTIQDRAERRCPTPRPSERSPFDRGDMKAVWTSGSHAKTPCSCYSDAIATEDREWSRDSFDGAPRRLRAGLVPHRSIHKTRDGARRSFFSGARNPRISHLLSRGNIGRLTRHVPQSRLGHQPGADGHGF